MSQPVSEKPPLLRIVEKDKPPIVSALEANITGLEMVRGDCPIPRGKIIKTADKLIDRYQDLINCPEYEAASSDPKYAQRLEELRAEGQKHLDDYNKCMIGVADVHAVFSTSTLSVNTA